MGDHPWGHGAQSIKTVPKGTVLDCGHKTKRKDETASLYGDDWLCDNCGLARCPVCEPAGRNVCLDKPFVEIDCTNSIMQGRLL